MMFDIAWTTEGYQGVCEDKVAAWSESDRCVIVVADGAGGTGLGGQAAAAVVDGVRSAAAHAHSPEAWVGVLQQIDARIGPGESTAVVVDVDRDGICGASVGDSQAWLVKGADLTSLTAGQHRKPLVGSGEATPVGFAHGRLDGVLIVATDGFCSYVKREEMLKVIPYEETAVLPRRLLALVRLRSSGLNDDAGIVVCRFRRAARAGSTVYRIGIEDLL